MPRYLTTRGHGPWHGNEVAVYHLAPGIFILGRSNDRTVATGEMSDKARPKERDGEGVCFMTTEEEERAASGEWMGGMGKRTRNESS